MTALSTPPGGYDGRPELRDEIAARLGLARHYAALAGRFLEIEDDAGAQYAVRSFLAYAQCSGEAWADLLAEIERVKPDRFTSAEACA